jgi:hypothetical protein
MGCIRIHPYVILKAKSTKFGIGIETFIKVYIVFSLDLLKQSFWENISEDLSSQS